MPSQDPGPTFRAAAAYWAMAMEAVGSKQVAAMGVRGWAPKTQTRYRSALSTLAGFGGSRALQSSLTDTLCEFLASRVSMGQAKSTLRGYVSAVRAAEDVRLLLECAGQYGTGPQSRSPNLLV